MTCAKRQVFCELYDKRGLLLAVGSNACDRPQEVCPRQPGEDYAKCERVCRQQGHAEEVALRFSESMHPASWMLGGRAVIYGHHRVCWQCREQLEEAGIASIEVRP